MKIGSFFSGIGGIEAGLAKHTTTSFFCENDPLAAAVLSERFRDIPNIGDIGGLLDFPEVDIITAGFPCQDLSFAGKKTGIDGEQSSLIGKIFETLRYKKNRPHFIIIENVPYMLSLGGGKAMSFIVSELSAMKYEWAYRVIDPRCFGIPQRRPRVILLASNQVHPKDYLFPISQEIPPKPIDKVGSVVEETLYGFYWTEGSRGLGWVKSALPPIKGGSTIGIASPPAVWNPATHMFFTPSIEDAEAIQGFKRGWTDIFQDKKSSRMRWRMVGNAVCVPVFSWVGDQVFLSGAQLNKSIKPQQISTPKWPTAAFSEKEKVYSVDVHWWPKRSIQYELRKYIHNPKPLSKRAADGFYSRIIKNMINLPDNFRTSLESYIENFPNGIE